MLIELDVDYATAVHLASALRRHQEAQAADPRQRACPRALVALEARLVDALPTLRNRPGPSGAVTVVGFVDDRSGEQLVPADRAYLSPREAAVVTGLSLSTIERSIRAGALASYRVGRSRRIAKAELRDFVEARR